MTNALALEIEAEGLIDAVMKGFLPDTAEEEAEEILARLDAFDLPAYAVIEPYTDVEGRKEATLTVFTEGQREVCTETTYWLGANYPKTISAEIISALREQLYGVRKSRKGKTIQFTALAQ